MAVFTSQNQLARLRPSSSAVDPETALDIP